MKNKPKKQKCVYFLKQNGKKLKENIFISNSDYFPKLQKHKKKISIMSSIKQNKAQLSMFNIVEALKV